MELSELIVRCQRKGNRCPPMRSEISLVGETVGHRINDDWLSLVIGSLAGGGAPPYNQIFAPIPRVFGANPLNRTATLGLIPSFR